MYLVRNGPDDVVVPAQVFFAQAQRLELLLMFAGWEQEQEQEQEQEPRLLLGLVHESLFALVLVLELELKLVQGFELKLGLGLEGLTLGSETVRVLQLVVSSELVPARFVELAHFALLP
jgi:hypothetical protein